MFFEEVKASFMAQGVAIADKMNQDAAARFLGACRNWAANGGRDGEPKPDVAVEAQFSFDPQWSLMLVPTDHPVSTIDPKTFLLTHGTDQHAIGGPVGGPIPDQPGRYYAASNATPYLGQVFRSNGKTYVFSAISPFNRAWEEI